MQPVRDMGGDGIDVLPVVVVMQSFPARPSAVPDIRDFVRRYLAHTPLSEEYIRALGHHVEDILLAAAGTGNAIQVSLRIFGNFAEVDILQVRHDELTGNGMGTDGAPTDGGSGRPERTPEATVGHATGAGPEGHVATRPGLSVGPGRTCAVTDQSGVSFAEWLAEALRREGMTMEAAARQLQVSVKTVSRWINGTTEPRLRELSRMRTIFGDLPFR